MPTLEIDGMRFTGTQEECAAFARSVRQPSGTHIINVVPPPPQAAAPTSSTVFLKNPASWPLPQSAASAAAASATSNRGVEEIALTFLRELRAHPEGLESEAVQRLVAASHPKGIGSRLGMVNNSLLANGMKTPETCFTSVRHPVEGRRWFPGPSIDDAIIALEKSLGRRTATDVAA